MNLIMQLVMFFVMAFVGGIGFWYASKFVRGRGAA